MRTLPSPAETVHSNQERYVPAYKLCCTAKARDRFAEELERVGEDRENLSQVISRKLAEKEAVHWVRRARFNVDMLTTWFSTARTPV